jgi:hypothetical protein
MKRDEMVAQFLDLSPPDRLAMLIRICFNMSIVARDVLHRADVDDKSKLQFAEGLTELYHQITQNIIARLADAVSRYPDNVLIEILYDHFIRLKMEEALQTIWNESLQKMHAAILKSDASSNSALN